MTAIDLAQALLANPEANIIVVDINSGEPYKLEGFVIKDASDEVSQNTFIITITH